MSQEIYLGEVDVRRLEMLQQSLDQLNDNLTKLNETKIEKPKMIERDDNLLVVRLLYKENSKVSKAISKAMLEQKPLTLLEGFVREISEVWEDGITKCAEVEFNRMEDSKRR